MRTAEISRKTAETDIFLRLDLDGAGKSEIDSGVGFLDHMLTLFARHGRFDLTLTCKGDTRVDDHHSVEDIGIALGTSVHYTRAIGKGKAKQGREIFSMISVAPEPDYYATRHYLHGRDRGARILPAAS